MLRTERTGRGRLATLWLVMIGLLTMVLAPMGGVATAQGIDCNRIVSAGAPATPIALPELEPVTAPEDATTVRFGYIPLSIYAPVFVAYEKGYFADYGIDLQLEPLPGGTDMVLLASTGDLDMAVSGIGPAFWNAINQGLAVEAVAPGHMESSPVASPLMISKKACEDGSITSVADLEGKRVAVNAPGATELWLDIALRTGGLTIDDVDLQYMSFPDAVVALDAGTLDASIIGEPLATSAEQQGLAVRLVSEMDVAGIQATMIFGNSDWMAANPDATAGVIACYLRASQDLTENFNDPVNLAIIQQYTEVPADLIAASVKPVYSVDGEVNLDEVMRLQQFFGDRGFLDYDELLDPASVVNAAYTATARELIEP
jgi:NitT/TauT family transport system substrate-binding protein